MKMEKLQAPLALLARLMLVFIFVIGSPSYAICAGGLGQIGSHTLHEPYAVSVDRTPALSTLIR